jgi:hypothetical protein
MLSYVQQNEKKKTELRAEIRYEILGLVTHSTHPSTNNFTKVTDFIYSKTFIL